MTQVDRFEDWLLGLACAALVVMWVFDLFSVAMQNAVIFAIAIVINLIAMHTHGLPIFRGLRAAVVVLSVMFLAAYIWLDQLKDPHDILRWGEVMRGVGRISIPVVWWGQALAVIKFGRLSRSAGVGTHE